MMTYDNFDLTKFNGYHLEATCAKAIFPDTEEDLIRVYQLNKDIRKIILGNGNNIILSKQYYNEHFIVFNGSFNTFEVKGREIIAQAGTTLLQLSETALQYNLSGFEVFCFTKTS